MYSYIRQFKTRHIYWVFVFFYDFIVAGQTTKNIQGKCHQIKRRVDDVLITRHFPFYLFVLATAICAWQPIVATRHSLTSDFSLLLAFPFPLHPSNVRHYYSVPTYVLCVLAYNMGMGWTLYVGWRFFSSDADAVSQPTAKYENE